MNKLENNEIKPIITLEQEQQKTISIYETDSSIVTNKIKLLNELAKAIKSNLLDGIDYGVIAGCGKKPILFKSGAQKIALLYGLVAKFEKVKDIQDRENGYVQVEYRCGLINSNEFEIAQGVGVETSDEKKHKGQNPFSLINNITKMAKKRALVDAVLMIGNLSEVFTQDLEDQQVQQQLQSEKLTKDEKLSIYSSTYDKFKTMYEWTDTKLKTSEWKDKVKQFVFKEIFPKLGITKSSFLEFTKEDADKYLNWLTNYNTQPTSELFKVGGT